jgi:hypothetical protein
LDPRITKKITTEFPGFPNSILGHSDETVRTVPCIVPSLMRCGVLAVAALALLQLPTGVRGADFVNFSAATAAAAFIGAQNRTYIGE